MFSLCPKEQNTIQLVPSQLSAFLICWFNYIILDEQFIFHKKEGSNYKDFSRINCMKEYVIGPKNKLEKMGGGYVKND